MATQKKIEKSTLDAVSPSIDSSKEMKTEKRKLVDPYEIDDDIFKPTRKYQVTKKKAKVNHGTSQQAKKQKVKGTVDSGNDKGLMVQYREMKNVNFDDIEAAEVRKKVQGLLNDQQKARKQLTEALFTNCSEILSQIETDYETMKSNESKMEQLTAKCMKDVHQTTLAFKETAKLFSKICPLKKQFDEMESRQIEARDQLMCKLDNDIKKLQEKLEKETKKQAWELISQQISHAIQD